MNHKSENTHSIGADKHNCAVTLTDRAEAILSDWAEALGKSRNQHMRELIAAGADATRSPRALALRSAMRTQLELAAIRYGAADIEDAERVVSAWEQEIGEGMVCLEGEDQNFFDGIVAEFQNHPQLAEAA